MTARATERAPIRARQKRHAPGWIVAHTRYLRRGPLGSRFVLPKRALESGDLFA
jgi:hypothetical protein